MCSDGDLCSHLDVPIEVEGEVKFQKNQQLASIFIRVTGTFFVELHPPFTRIEAINFPLNHVHYYIFTRVVNNMFKWSSTNWTGLMTTYTLLLHCIFKLVSTGYRLTRFQVNHKFKQLHACNVIVDLSLFVILTNNNL